MNRYSSSRSRSARLAPWAAVRMIAPAPRRSSLAASLRKPLALLVIEATGHADALAVGGQDHIAPGDGQIHRQPGALGLQWVLDHLDDDVLPRLEHVGDLAALAGPAASAPGRIDAGEHDLVDVEKAVLLQADVDERGFQAGQDVVDPALVDVAHDRAGTATLEIELGDLIPGGRVGALATPARAAEPGLRSATVPVASSSATRVSPRSTLTSTCFFNCLQSFIDRRPAGGRQRGRNRMPPRRAPRGADEMRCAPGCEPPEPPNVPARMCGAGQGELRRASV